MHSQQTQYETLDPDFKRNGSRLQKIPDLELDPLDGKNSGLRRILSVRIHDIFTQGHFPLKFVSWIHTINLLKCTRCKTIAPLDLDLKNFCPHFKCLHQVLRNLQSTLWATFVLKLRILLHCNIHIIVISYLIERFAWKYFLLVKIFSNFHARMKVYPLFSIWLYGTSAYFMQFLPPVF